MPFALKNVKPIAMSLGKKLLKAAVKGNITKASLRKLGKVAAQKGIEVGKSVGRAAIQAGTKAVKRKAQRTFQEIFEKEDSPPSKKRRTRKKN